MDGSPQDAEAAVHETLAARLRSLAEAVSAAHALLQLLLPRGVFLNLGMNRLQAMRWRLRQQMQQRVSEPVCTLPKP